MVLARNLDTVLVRDYGREGRTAEYHARYVEAVGGASPAASA